MTCNKQIWHIPCIIWTKHAISFETTKKHLIYNRISYIYINGSVVIFILLKYGTQIAVHEILATNLRA